MASTSTGFNPFAASTTGITSTSVVVNTVSITSPLDTAFTPDSGCVAPTFTLSPLGYDSIENGDLVRGLNPGCYPYGFIPSILNDAPPVPTYTGGNGGFTTITQIVFSGVPCPGSYTAAESTITMYSNRSFNLLTCCPSRMSLSTQSESSLACVARNLNVTIEEASYSGNFQNRTSYTTKATRVRAPAIVALSPTIVSSTSSSTTSGSSTSTQPSSSTSSLSALPTSQAPGGGLSTGAKAGIGVGAGLGGFVLIAVIIFLALFLRRKRKVEPQAPAKDEAPAFDKAELSGEGKAFPELSAQAQLLEADPYQRPLEMDSSNTRAELEGDPVAERPG